MALFASVSRSIPIRRSNVGVKVTTGLVFHARILGRPIAVAGKARVSGRVAQGVVHLPCTPGCRTGMAAIACRRRLGRNMPSGGLALAIGVSSGMAQGAVNNPFDGTMSGGHVPPFEIRFNRVTTNTVDRLDRNVRCAARQLLDVRRVGAGVATLTGQSSNDGVIHRVVSPDAGAFVACTAISRARLDVGGGGSGLTFDPCAADGVRAAMAARARRGSDCRVTLHPLAEVAGVVAVFAGHARDGHVSGRGHGRCATHDLGVGGIGVVVATGA